MELARGIENAQVIFFERSGRFPYTVLVTAFGWGVWKSAGRIRVLRIVGGLIVAYGALGLVWPLAPMHLREVLAAGGSTQSDTMHIVLASVTVPLMLLAIGFGAAAFGKQFRVYSIASISALYSLTVRGWSCPLFSPRPIPRGVRRPERPETPTAAKL